MNSFAGEQPAAPGYLALPESGSGPGVLVLHAWWGLTPFFKDLCERLAEAGFVALAPDLYGGPTANTIEQAEQLLDKSDYEAIRQRVVDAVEYFQQSSAVEGDGLGAIGFSLGAAWALLLSDLLPEIVRAVVVFYGSESVDFARANAAYLGHYCENDEWEPKEGVLQMEADMIAAGKRVEFHFYPDTRHWFFESDRPEFNAAAAQLAWDRTLEFLRRTLTRPANH